MDNFNMSMMGGGGNNPQGGKKAVHVKWAGKTIALGTFPHQEAEEKCARAKALTRAWRSTMRPKPTREWVMLELERLGVRVVSGRLKSGGPGGESGGGAGVGDDDSADSVGGGGGDTKGVNNNMSGMAAMGMGNNMGMMGNNMPNLGSDPSPGSSNHRPLVGGGSAAAYEAARADHYGKLDNKQGGAAQGGNIGGNINNNMPSMPNNNNNMAAPMPSFGLSVNPNQHYEMLKLHHMNLLNEIQETTLMMNLYQQQQLQQQGGAGGGNMSNNNMGNMSNNNMNQMGQMGGGNQMGGQQNNMTPLMNQGMMNQNQGMNNQGVMLGSNGMNNNAPQDQLSTNNQDRPSSSASGNVNGATAGESKEDKAAWLKQLKDDIAKREKEAEALEASIGNDEKRKNDDGTPSSNKKAKLDTTAV